MLCLHDLLALIGGMVTLSQASAQNLQGPGTWSVPVTTIRAHRFSGKGQGQGVRIAHLGLTFLLHMRGCVRRSPRTPLWFYKMNWMSTIKCLEMLRAPFKPMLSPLSSGILRVSTSWRKAAGTWTGTMGKGWNEVHSISPSLNVEP